MASTALVRVNKVRSMVLPANKRGFCFSRLFSIRLGVFPWLCVSLFTLPEAPCRLIGFWFRSCKLNNDDRNAVANRINRTKLCDSKLLALRPSLRFTSTHNRRSKTGERVEPPTRKAQNDGKLLNRIALVRARAIYAFNVSSMSVVTQWVTRSFYYEATGKLNGL